MLLIDDRAGSNELIPLLSGSDTHVCRLESGDICIPGNGPSGDILVGVEVKKVPDLLDSEATGRLAATQLPRLLVDYSEIWLLVIGDFRPSTNGTLQVSRNSGWQNYRVGQREVPYSYLEGFLIELQTMGVNYERVRSNWEAAWFLRVLEHWWSKPWDKHKAMKKFDRSSRPRIGMIDIADPDYRRKMQTAETANSFPSIGWERAWAISECFPSPFAFMSSTPAQLEEVPGIGKVMANSIWRAIHGK